MRSVPPALSPSGQLARKERGQPRESLCRAYRTLLDTVTRPHGVSFVEGDVMMASLDHAMWFHRPFRADRWFLYAQDTPSASRARGLARGLLYQDGDLIVSVVQEGLVRPLTI